MQRQSSASVAMPSQWVGFSIRQSRSFHNLEGIQASYILLVRSCCQIPDSICAGPSCWVQTSAHFWRFFEVSNPQLFPQPQAKFDLTKWQFGCHRYQQINRIAWMDLSWIHVKTQHSCITSLLKENPCFSKKISCILVLIILGGVFLKKLKKTYHHFLSFCWRPCKLDRCGLRLWESSFSWEGLAVRSLRAEWRISPWIFYFSNGPRWQPKAPVVEEDFWGFFWKRDLGWSWAFGIEYVNKNDEIWRYICILRTFFEGTLVVNNLYQTLISGGGRLGKFA